MCSISGWLHPLNNLPTIRVKRDLAPEMKLSMDWILPLSKGFSALQNQPHTLRTWTLFITWLFFLWLLLLHRLVRWQSSIYIFSIFSTPGGENNPTPPLLEKQHSCVKYIIFHCPQWLPERRWHQLKGQSQGQWLPSFGHVCEVHGQHKLISLQLPISIYVSQGPAGVQQQHQLEPNITTNHKLQLKQDTVEKQFLKLTIPVECFGKNA